MFTNNYIKYRKAQFFATTDTFTTPANSTFTSHLKNDYVANIYGDLGVSMCTGRCKEVPITYESYNTSNGVYFGSGTTPAARTDYALEAPIKSGLTITNPSTFLLDNDGAGKYTYSMPFILTNTTATDIIINEVGLFTPVPYYYSSSKYGYYQVLMERTVLDAPVIVPARDSVLFTYKISFHHITE